MVISYTIFDNNIIYKLVAIDKAVPLLQVIEKSDAR